MTIVFKFTRRFSTLPESFRLIFPLFPGNRVTNFAAPVCAQRNGFPNTQDTTLFVLRAVVSVVWELNSFRMFSSPRVRSQNESHVRPFFSDTTRVRVNARRRFTGTETNKIAGRVRLSRGRLQGSRVDRRHSAVSPVRTVRGGKRSKRKRRGKRPLSQRHRQRLT